jgi:ElaB/YqjD/DUF883 family membrane-anchored ribosome-binding protein
MLDLKPYYDAVVTADADVKRVANDIDTLFREGTDEAKEKALALQEPLDIAQAKFNAATKLYESLKKANTGSDVAQRFVPVSDAPATPEDDESPRMMKRSDWIALSPSDRATFIKGGGKLED